MPKKKPLQEVEEVGRKVADYIRTRLAAECEEHRGRAADVARVTGLTPSMVSQVRRGESPAGPKFAGAIAIYWGMTLDQLGAVALGQGEAPEINPSPAPPRSVPAEDPDASNPHRPGAAPEWDEGVASPAPPPVSETRVIDDRVKELLDEAWDSEEYEPSDALLVGEVLSANAALVRPDVEPVDLVRALLDTAAEARAKGKKISAQDLPAIALVSTKRQLLDAERRLQEFLARAKAEAEMLGVETRNTPHPALLRAREKMHGIPANKRKKAPKLCSGQ